jgi:hypothetical protein
MTRSRGSLLLAAVLLAITVLLGILAALGDLVPRPVVGHFGGPAIRLAVVHVGAAVLVPPLLVAVVAAVRGTGRLERAAVPSALGAASPIVLFLVARLNSVAEAVALVLVYASTAGGVLLRSLHRPGADPMPLRWAAVLGIVPWGVVAFTQVGGQLTGTPVPPGVPLLTVLVLTASIAEYVVAYRRRNAPLAAPVALALTALPGVLLAVGTLALVR